MECPQDERGQGRHLVGELSEMVHAVREEGVDHSRDEARSHAAGDRVCEQVRQRPARDQGDDGEQVDDEQRRGAQQEQRGRQEPREELRLLVCDRAGIGVVEREIVEAERIAQHLVGVPRDDAGLHLVIPGAAAKDGRREPDDQGIRVDGGHGPIEEDDQGAVA